MEEQHEDVTRGGRRWAGMGVQIRLHGVVEEWRGDVARGESMEE